MSDYIRSLSAKEQKIIADDAAGEGYSFPGVEDFIHYLNKGQVMVYRSDGTQAPLTYFIDNDRILPYAAHFPDIDNIPHHHARGSQFSSSKCIEAVLESHIDDEKLENATGRKVKSLIPAQAGDIRHRIVSAPGLMHEKYSGFLEKRHEYAEKRVAYRFSVKGLENELDELFEYMAGSKDKPELWDMSNFNAERKYYKDWFRQMKLDWRDSGIDEYVIKGTADTILKFENKNMLALMDWKRTRYYKNSFGMQMVAYSLAVEQMLGKDFDSYMIISVTNNFGNKPLEYNMPQALIMEILKDDTVIRTLKLKTVFLHTVIRALIENPDIFLSFRDFQRTKEMTKFSDEPCSRCEVLYTGTACSNLSNDLCDLLYDFVKEGGSMKDLLIDGFQIRD
jgi:hypothetical protein